MVKHALVLALTGCTVGYPLTDEPEVEGASLWEDDGACIGEWEPNDLPSEDHYHFLGVPGAQQPTRVCGALSSTGVNDENLLTGDLDFYIIELLDPAWVTVRLDPRDGDPHLYLATPDVFEEREWSGSLPPGLHGIRVAASSGPAGSYLLEVWAE